MKKFSIKNWMDKIRFVALRFPFTLFFLIGFTVFMIMEINRSDNNSHHRTWTIFALGTLITLAVTLLSETFTRKWLKIILNLLAIILLMLYTLFLPEKFETIHFYQVFSIGIVLLLSYFSISFLRKDNDIPFWEFSKTSVVQLIISTVFAQVLMAGLSLAVLSLKELFKIEIDSKIYGDIAVICYVLFGGIYFLANIPDESAKLQQTYTFNKFLKVLGLYILLPILAVYSLILYVYLVQIVVKWQLPNGYVSTLVSVLGVGGFLTMLIVFPLRLEKNKITDIVYKYFPLVLIPLLILMSIGIFRRLGDYGMTINRLYVLLLNLWLYGISIYVLVSNAKHLKWAVISFATVLFISSVGPWSVYEMTKRKMKNEIGQLLSEANLLKDGKVENKKRKIGLSPKKSEILTEDIKYVCTNYGIMELQPFFKDSIGHQGWSQLTGIIGINELPIHDTFFNAWIERSGSDLSDISGYRSFVNLPNFYEEKTDILKSKQISVKLQKYILIVDVKGSVNQHFSIQLKPKLKEIIQGNANKNSYNVEKMTINTENCKLILNSVRGNYFSQNDSIHISNCDALLFLK